MAIVRNELSYREDARTLDAFEASKWRVISTLEDNVDVSQCRSGYDVAIMLGDILMKHLHNPQNPMRMRQIVGGPAYTYGQTSATATIFFEGALMNAQTACMKVCSWCVWAGDRPYV